MKKEIAVVLREDVDALFNTWAVPGGVKYEKRDGKTELLFPEKHFNDFYRLEQAVNQIKQSSDISLAIFYKAYILLKKTFYPAMLYGSVCRTHTHSK